MGALHKFRVGTYHKYGVYVGGTLETLAPAQGPASYFQGR